MFEKDSTNIKHGLAPSKSLSAFIGIKVLSVIIKGGGT